MLWATFLDRDRSGSNRESNLLVRRNLGEGIHSSVRILSTCNYVQLLLILSIKNKGIRMERNVSLWVEKILKSSTSSLAGTVLPLDKHQKGTSNYPSHHRQGGGCSAMNSKHRYCRTGIREFRSEGCSWIRGTGGGNCQCIGRGSTIQSHAIGNENLGEMA